MLMLMILLKLYFLTDKNMPPWVEGTDHLKATENIPNGSIITEIPCTVEEFDFEVFIGVSN